MKIVLAEKVSPATLAVLKEEPDWNVVTADAIAKLGPGGLEAELADADALVVPPPCKWTPRCYSPRPSCAPSVAPESASTTSTSMPPRTPASS